MSTTTDIHLTTDFPVPPEVLYEAWLDGRQHAAMTGAPASGEATVGAAFSAWDGYIWGANLELEPHHRIVQSWTTGDFPEGCPPSRLEVRFENGPQGTRLTLTQTQIPPGQTDNYRQGWEDYYFKPMRDYFQN